MQHKHKAVLAAILLLLLSGTVRSDEKAELPSEWSSLQHIMSTRVSQSKPKMKLTQQQSNEMMQYLQSLSADQLPHLQALQKVMPKTTLELLFGMQARGVSKTEAEKIAEVLLQFYQKSHFKNPAPFDENTSHIIGREWHEIDYSGEGMTWQGQKAKYAPYGITNFKTADNVKKFLRVESQLPYFKKIYKPQR